MAISDHITRLLADPTFNLGVGILGAPGGSNFGEALSHGTQFANQRQQMGLQNDFLRERIQRQAQERKASADLQTFVAKNFVAQPGSMPGTPGAVVDPRQSEFLQLAARVNPAAAMQMAGGILGFGQDDRKTSLIKNLQAAGIDPASEEGRGLITASISGGDISTQLAKIQAIQAQLDVERRQEELANIRSEREAAERTSEQNKVDLRNSIATDVSRGLEAANLLTELEGTALQTGEASNVRQFGVGLFGLINPESRELAAKSERFNQIATGFGLRTIELLKGTGTISNQKFATLLENSLSGTRSPEANKAALADIFEETLNGADKLGIEVPQRSDIEALIPQLRGSTGNRRFRYNPATGQLEPQ